MKADSKSVPFLKGLPDTLESDLQSLNTLANNVRLLPNKSKGTLVIPEPLKQLLASLPDTFNKSPEGILLRAVQFLNQLSIDPLIFGEPDAKLDKLVQPLNTLVPLIGKYPGHCVTAKTLVLF